MISYLRGKIKLIREEFLILDVSGVGYRIYGTHEMMLKLKKTEGEIEIYIYQHVREDSNELFGFLRMEEMEFFEIIISVSGVGPRVGLAIMEISNVSDIKKAIATSNVDYLTRVPGIGRKKAELIILELKSKMDVLVSGKDIEMSGDDNDAINALVRLGYSSQEARQSLDAVPKDITDQGERIKQALKNMGKK